MKNKIKTFIFFLYNAASSVLTKKRAAILLYHSIDDNDVFHSLSPKIFRKQMEYLKRNRYNVIKLEELERMITVGQEIPKKTVALTFDDGFLSHYDNAFPVLKEYGFPATFFVCTGLLGSEMNNSQNRPQLTLDWRRLKEMNESALIDIEPHGITHMELDSLKMEEAEKEIKQSKRELEEKLNKKCFYYACPRGKYNEKIISILRNNGFKAAVSVKEGSVEAGDNLFELKRNTKDSSCPDNIQFCARLRGGVIIFNKLMRR